MLTADMFVKKLKSGGYKGIAGARRALGKAQELSELEKNQVRAQIDKYYQAAPAAKVTPKKTAKVAKAASAKPEAPKARKVQAKKSPKVTKESVAKKILSGKAASLLDSSFEDILRDSERAVMVGLSAIQAAGEAVRVGLEYKRLFPNSDVTEILSAAEVLKQALRLIEGTVTSPPEEKASSNGAKKIELPLKTSLVPDLSAVD